MDPTETLLALQYFCVSVVTLLLTGTVSIYIPNGSMMSVFKMFKRFLNMVTIHMEPPVVFQDS